jgi:hypothetical protein
MNLLSLSLESLLPLCRARLMIKVAIVVACCGLCSSIPAVSPATDGGYPNNNTAEGADALFNLTTGVGNTATASALSMSPPPRANPQPSKFVFKDASGKATSVDVIQSYQSTKIARPFTTADRQLDPKLMRAATIAEERAHAHSRRQCWHAVKEALLASGVISSRPKTEYAKQAAQELVNNYGFRKLPLNDPYQAPVGSVLVYNANRTAGHVEIRTKDGFVSDFRSKTPSHRPLLGVFVKS